MLSVENHQNQVKSPAEAEALGWKIDSKGEKR